MGAKLFKIGKDKGMLISEHGTELTKTYARLAYSSVMANTT